MYLYALLQYSNPKLQSEADTSGAKNFSRVWHTHVWGGQSSVFLLQDAQLHARLEWSQK